LAANTSQHFVAALIVIGYTKFAFTSAKLELFYFTSKCFAEKNNFSRNFSHHVPQKSLKISCSAK